MSPEAPEPGASRVVVFRPVVRVELAALDGVGDEEAVVRAIDTWSRALVGSDPSGRPEGADWWVSALVDVAVVVSVELVGVRWSVATPEGGS